MRPHLDREVDPRLFECVGGSLDGQVLELPPHVARYVVLDAADQPAETYVVRWWTKRDVQGRRMWERECRIFTREA